MNEFDEDILSRNEGELRKVQQNQEAGPLLSVDIHPTRRTFYKDGRQFLRFKDISDYVRFIYTTRKGKRITKSDITKCIAFLKAMDAPFHPDFKEKPTDAL